MKRLVFIALLLLSFGVQGQNRFPSIDSAKNYVLRYVKASAVESFSNLRLQNVVYGTLQLLDSLAGAGAVDSIWIGTGDTLKYRVGSGTFVVGKIGGGTYTFTNGLTESGGVVKLGGTLTEETFVDGNQQITFLLRENVNNSIYWLNQKGVTVSDTLNNNSGGIYLNRFNGITTSYIGSDSIKLHNGDGVSPYTRTTASLSGNQLLSMNTTTGAVSRFTGSVLTSIPTLAQVTAAGNFVISDSIVFRNNSNAPYITFRNVQSGPPDNFTGKIVVGTTLSSSNTAYGNGVIEKNNTNSIAIPDTSGTLSVGVKLNGTTYMAGSNGIANIPNLVDSIYRKAGQDSIFYRRGGSEFAIKDSVGSGGGSGGVQWTGVDSLFSYNMASNGYHEHVDFNTDITRYSRYNTTGGGSGTFTSGSDFAGAYILNTGTGATSGFTIFHGTTGLAQAWMVLSADPIWNHYRIRIPDLSDGTNTYRLRLGWTANVTTAALTNAVSIVYDASGLHTGSAASGNWQIVTASASNRTWETTSTAVPSNTWVTVSIRATSTECRFYVNGVQVGSAITNNIPTVAMYPHVEIVKSAGSASRSVQVDYITIDQRYSTPR